MNRFDCHGQSSVFSRTLREYSRVCTPQRRQRIQIHHHAESRRHYWVSRGSRSSPSQGSLQKAENPQIQAFRPNCAEQPASSVDQDTMAPKAPRLLHSALYGPGSCYAKPRFISGSQEAQLNIDTYGNWFQTLLYLEEDSKVCISAKLCLYLLIRIKGLIWTLIP